MHLSHDDCARTHTQKYNDLNETLRKAEEETSRLWEQLREEEKKNKKVSWQRIVQKKRKQSESSCASWLMCALTVFADKYRVERK